MAKTLLPDPVALTLDRIIPTDETIMVIASARQATAACPCCGKTANRVHSRYLRTIADLPWQGIAVRFLLHVRKFFCDTKGCKRRIFTEPLPQVARRYARKTVRLAEALTELAFLVGGEAAARIARAFGLMVSPDALLDAVKKTPMPSFPTPKVLGIDDFAFKRGHVYGTILVDLERHCPVDLLPDRDADSVATWLKQHPGVEIISRDRGSAYREGATRGAPNAVQVADRWHLLKNLGDALECLLTRHHAALREASKPDREASKPDAVETALNISNIPATSPPVSPISPSHLADKQNRRDRRQARFAEVKDLLGQRQSHREVARRTGYSRNTVAKLAGYDTLPEPAARPKRHRKLTPFVAHLRQRWAQGVYNATRLHEEITTLGFSGNVSAVQRYVTGWREKPRSRINGRHPPPISLSPRQASWMLTNPAHARITQEQRTYLQRLTEQNPTLAAAQQLALDFCRLVRERRANEFPQWLEAVQRSDVAELKSFARSLEQDRSAVEAGLSLPWSNGQVEGQVNRLKFLKRSMYGSAGFDLLKVRVLHRVAV